MEFLKILKIMKETNINSQDFISSNIELIESLNKQLEVLTEAYIKLNRKFSKLFPAVDFRGILKDVVQICTSYDDIQKFYVQWADTKHFQLEFKLFEACISNQDIEYRTPLKGQIQDLINQYDFDDLINFIREESLDISKVDSQMIIENIFKKEFCEIWSQINITSQDLIKKAIDSREL